ncbi:uncharacterized protein LOC144095998 [Amblyomma americanum]
MPWDSAHLIEKLKKMLDVSRQAVREGHEAVARLGQELLDQIEDNTQTRLKVYRQLENDSVIASGTNEVQLSSFSKSKIVPQLLKYEVKQHPDFKASSLGYIQACEAVPEDMGFACDYSAMTFSVGSSVRLVCTCTFSYYDHFLFMHLAVFVTSPSGEEVKTTNQDLENRSYMASFVPTATGVHVVRVTLYKQDILGSPLEVNVAKAFSLESILCSPRKAAASLEN